MSSNRARAAIYRPLPPKPGPGWGTKSCIDRPFDPLDLVSIYLSTIYSIVLYGLILYLGSALHIVSAYMCTTLHIVPTISWVFRTFRPQYIGFRPFFCAFPISRGFFSSSTRSCALYLLHTPIHYILYIYLVIILYWYYILWWLRIFRPSPLRPSYILYTRMSISTISRSTTISCTWSLYTTISCPPHPFAPRLHILHKPGPEHYAHNTASTRQHNRLSHEICALTQFWVYPYIYIGRPKFAPSRAFRDILYLCNYSNH